MTEQGLQHDLDVRIDAPVHEVFTFCLDPRGIYVDDPSYEVVEVVLTEEGAGTTAAVRSGGRVLAEEVSLEYVDVVPDRRLVVLARSRMVVGGRGAGFALPDSEFTWGFAAESGGTRLSLRVVVPDPPRRMRLLDRLGGKDFERQVRVRLARIRAAVEQGVTASVRTQSRST